MWDVKNPERGSDKGRKVHEVLSYIKERKDLDDAIKRALREGLISNLEKKYGEEVRKLYQYLTPGPRTPGLHQICEKDTALMLPMEKQ